ncbi:hypothetical protein DFH07DRAFT_826364 [Mycena maculata]|uniref:F-box domain-containing protein n=1 Tax=Mycena maculata TaxID=230809 RepID=A0AAD7IZ95_9AGAR|nr:hypothetical protein DFH07DRAFT_826364 [Mycena maculata]
MMMHHLPAAPMSQVLPSQREDIQRPIQRWPARVVYPIITLPREITSEIFLHCLPPAPDFSSKLVFPHPSFDLDENPELKADPYPHNPRPSEAPFLLLQVCSAWRSIALVTPRLWTHLHLNLADINYFSFYPDLEEFIADWFTRAGSCPLFFSGNWSSIAASSASASLNTTLLRYAPRLRNLALQLHEQQLGELGALAAPFPLLEKLAISISFPASQLRTFPDFFCGMPRLKELYLNMVPSMFSIPWAQLTKFACGNVDNLANVFHAAPLLTDLTCSISEDSHELATDITHARLQTLCLVNRSSGHFLPRLLLPSLQTLHLKDGEELYDDLLPFLALSATSLRTFSSFGLPIAPLALDWFSAMPNLTHVTVYAPPPDFAAPFFARLDRAQDSTFLPHLHFLAFVYSSFNLTPPMLHALSSRCTGGDAVAKLHTFMQVWPTGFVRTLGKATIATLQQLVEQGMQIHVGPAEV